MERLKKLRTPVRRNITHLVNQIEAELQRAVPDVNQLEDQETRLKELQAEVGGMDRQVLAAMADADAAENEIEVEYGLMEPITAKIHKALREIRQMRQIIQERDRAAQNLHNPIPVVVPINPARDNERVYHLPKIELYKFNGELTEWLPFWSQFQKIHEDDRIPACDKFHYLIQSLTAGSAAREVVNSFNPTAANYPNAVEALRQRFGKEKLIRQVYLRELIKISNNARFTTTKDIPKLFVKLQSHLRSLETLGITRQQYAEILYPILESCIPEDMLIAWQRHPNHGRDGSVLVPPQTDLCFLMEFLEKEVDNMTARTLANNGFGSSSQDNCSPARNATKKPKNDDNVPTASGLFTGKGSICIFCEKSHESKECGRAREISQEDKKAKVQKSGACFYCLKIGHSANKCKSFVKCVACGLKHQTVMCPDLHGKKKTDERQKPSETKTVGGAVNLTIEEPSDVMTVSEALNCTKDVLLQTLLVSVRGRHGPLTMRLLIDSGSQLSFIRKAVVKKLGLTSIGEEVMRKALFGGGVTKPMTHNIYKIELMGLCEHPAVGLMITVRDEPAVCGRIPKVPQGSWIQELRRNNIIINDVDSNSSHEVDILVGSDFMGQLVTGKMFQLEGGLTAAETILGWTLYGRLPSTDSTPINVATSSHIEASIQDLWSLETIGIRECTDSQTKEEREIAAHNHFKRTVTRQSDGRYSVSLPWIIEDLEIPSNRKVAEARLRNATTKLVTQGEYSRYELLFKQWLEEGIIEVVPNNELRNKAHYLPHRPVFKPESLTTPVRPVFDASCKQGRAPSLNECLEKGINLLELIPAILHRFREKKIGIVSDIRKAFQMIDLNQQDRDFMRFLWWEDDSRKQFIEYRHARVVFGVNCSPFLLAAVLEQHLKSVEGEERIVAEQLLDSLYVDNCITSLDTSEEYENFKSISIKIMADAKMELRQWERTIEEGTRVGPTQDPGCGLGPVNGFVHPTLSSVLGMKWDKLKDELFCLVPKKETQTKITKRVILSQIQKIFDPLGILSPALLPPKLMIQKAWAKEVDWDQELDSDTAKDFEKWWTEASILENVRIPRKAFGTIGNVFTIQVHTFCDASQDAYAAVVYLRIQEQGKVTVQLLQSKARVAPLKKVTIPRLELLSCTIAARLSSFVVKSLRLEQAEKFFWSDSTTALAWIQRNDDWGTFVGNRVREICNLTSPNEWRHVPGIGNPADLPSRGCTPKELLRSKWWEGPEWLKCPPEEWPSFQPAPKEELVYLEKKKTTISMTTGVCEDSPWYCVRSSSHRKNVRVMAWILRFVSKLRKQCNKSTNELQQQECRAAEMVIFRLVQQESFRPGKDMTIGGIHLEKKNELLVVKTKLTNRQDFQNFLYPVLLPNRHPVVDQLIREEHLIHHHGGIQFLMGKIRERCWILQGRKAIKRIVSQCVTCRLHSNRAPVVPEAPLPEDRVKDAKAFQVVGVDLAGPLFLKDQGKAWIVLFTCAVYRCVHLELVQSLSTDAFLLALHRFISRRGRPSTIYSDNGTNFVGADNLFKKLDWKRIQRDSNVVRIQWRFNPPSAAWWGGWWERLIRSMKDLLKRMLGHKKLRYVQMETGLCEIEAIMNGRPLTYVTEDQEDLIPLTPAMFLQDVQSSQFPEGEALDADGLRTSLDDLQKLKSELRSRFRKEYLSLLVQRRKGKEPHVFRVGDIVHVSSDNRKRLEWPLGKIIELIPGKDGKVRVGKVKTSTGILLRPLQRLFPLEVTSDDNAIPVSESMKLQAMNKDKSASSDCANDSVNEIRTRRGRLVKPPVRFAQMNLAFRLKC